MVYKKVLCPVDFSRSSRVAFEAAIGIAKASAASLLLAHVYPAPPAVTIPELAMDHAFVRNEIASAEAQLRDWVREAEGHGAKQVSMVALPGTPWREIVDLAAAQRVDLVVMGSHGRTGLARAFYGSVAEHVVQHARTSVLIVRDPPSTT